MLALLASSLQAGCSRGAAAPHESPSGAETGRGASPSLSVTYLANEGFLLESGEEAVLLDAIFGDGLAGYPAVPMPLRDEIERGLGRFGEVDCVLATHAHADHFDPKAVARFLANVPAQFVSTEEAVREIEPLVANRALPPPRWLRPGRHVVELFDCGGLAVSAMSLHHGRLMIKNLAFIVEIGDLKVLHVGDTEITADEVRPWRLSEIGIDVALLPAWHLTEPTWLPLVREIAPGAIVAMHLASPDAPRSWFGSDGSLEDRIEEIRRRSPDAWIPTLPLEERTFSRRGEP